MAGKTRRVPDAAGGSVNKWDGGGRCDVVARSAGVGESPDASSDAVGEGD